MKNTHWGPVAVIPQPRVAPPPVQEEDPVQLVVTHDWDVMRFISGFDLVSDIVWNVSDCQIYLRQKFLFCGQLHFVRRRAPKDRSGRVRPCSGGGEPQRV